MSAPPYGRPPRLILPRVEAEAVQVVAVAEVESVSYYAAGQRLEGGTARARGHPGPRPGRSAGNS
jgi:hypothetical protein